MKTKIFNLFFNFWLFISKYDTYETGKYRVYCNNDIVDTLGYNYENGKYTYSWTEELGSYYGFNLPFGYKLQYTSGCGTDDISIRKNKMIKILLSN